MRKASSDAMAPATASPTPCVPSAVAPSRIISAEALRGVASFDLGALPAPAGDGPRPPLRARDLDNEVGRAAYALGRRRGFEEGARSGMQQGYSEGSQALEDFESRKAADVARQMQALVDSFRSELGLLESQVASDLVSLAIDIAREVLRRELALDPRAVLPAATEALRTLGEGASRLELRAHPQDAEVLRQHLQDQPGAPAWQVHEDPAMARGGVRIEADTGIADASFEARWQAVMAGLGRDEEPMP